MLLLLMLLLLMLLMLLLLMLLMLLLMLLMLLLLMLLVLLLLMLLLLSVLLLILLLVLLLLPVMLLLKFARGRSAHRNAVQTKEKRKTNGYVESLPGHSPDTEAAREKRSEVNTCATPNKTAGRVNFARRADGGLPRHT